MVPEKDLMRKSIVINNEANKELQRALNFKIHLFSLIYIFSKGQLLTDLHVRPVYPSSPVNPGLICRD